MVIPAVSISVCVLRLGCDIHVLIHSEVVAHAVRVGAELQTKIKESEDIPTLHLLV